MSKNNQQEPLGGPESPKMVPLADVEQYAEKIFRDLLDSYAKEGKPIPQPKQGVVPDAPIDFSKTPVEPGWKTFVCTENQLARYLKLPSPTVPGEPMYVIHSEKVGDTGQVGANSVDGRYICLRCRIADAEAMTTEAAKEAQQRLMSAKQKVAASGTRGANSQVESIGEAPMIK